MGCDQNVILGLTEVFSSHDSLIYLEDDIVPNPHFYDRMCRLLEALPTFVLSGCHLAWICQRN